MRSITDFSDDVVGGMWGVEEDFHVLQITFL
jgi:hypothetical protein